MGRRFLLLSAVALAALVAARRATGAESATETRLRDALRAATAQVRTLEDERSRLQAADAEQKKEIEELKKKLAAATAAAAAAAHRPPPPTNERELAECTKRAAEQTEAKEKLGETLGQCQAALREATQATRAAEDAHAQVDAQLGPLNDRISLCENRNEKMYLIAKGVLDRYEKMSAWEMIRAREPFLGLSRVQLENMAQADEDKLRDQRLKY